MESNRPRRSRPQHRPGYRKFGRLLAEWRKLAGMSQRDLAAKLKMPQSAIAKAETGNRGVDVFELIDWCRACNIALDEAILQVAGQA